MAAVKAGPNSTEKNKAPTEPCPLHKDFTVSGLLKNTVKICADPRHGGQLFAANTPNIFQSGGCPSNYVYEIVLPKGQKLPSCSLADHQLHKK
jgi:penicillin-binding protein 1A